MHMKKVSRASVIGARLGHSQDDDQEPQQEEEDQEIGQGLQDAAHGRSR